MPKKANKAPVRRRRPSKPTTVKSIPVTFSVTSRHRAPTITSNGRNVIVSHTEFFDVLSNNITAPATLASNVLAWTVQPGWSALFPWLSRMASNYEKYRFLDLSVKYIPRCGTNTYGSVVFAFDGDVHDKMPPIDEVGRAILLSHEGAVTALVSSPISCKPPTRLLGRELFVHSGNEETEPEPRTSHAGTLFCGLFNSNWDGACGDLEISYKIELLYPQLPNPADAPELSDSAEIYNSTVATRSSGNGVPSDPFIQLVSGATSLLDSFVANSSSNQLFSKCVRGLLADASRGGQLMGGFKYTGDRPLTVSLGARLRTAVSLASMAAEVAADSGLMPRLRTWVADTVGTGSPTRYSARPVMSFSGKPSIGTDSLNEVPTSYGTAVTEFLDLLFTDVVLHPGQWFTLEMTPSEYVLDKLNTRSGWLPLACLWAVNYLIGRPMTVHSQAAFRRGPAEYRPEVREGELERFMQARNSQSRY